MFAGLTGLVLGDHVGLGRQRGVDRVVSEVQEEWLLLVLLQEFLGLGGEAVGEVFAVGCLFQTRHIASGFVAERSEVAESRPGFVTRDVHVEALLFRLEALPAEVPFAKVAGGVPRRLPAPRPM